MQQINTPNRSTRTSSSGVHEHSHARTQSSRAGESRQLNQSARSVPKMEWACLKCESEDTKAITANETEPIAPNCCRSACAHSHLHIHWDGNQTQRVRFGPIQQLRGPRTRELTARCHRSRSRRGRQREASRSTGEHSRKKSDSRTRSHTTAPSLVPVVVLEVSRDESPRGVEEHPRGDHGHAVRGAHRLNSGRCVFMTEWTRHTRSVGKASASGANCSAAARDQGTCDMVKGRTGSGVRGCSLARSTRHQRRTKQAERVLLSLLNWPEKKSSWPRPRCKTQHTDNHANGAVSAANREGGERGKELMRRKKYWFACLVDAVLRDAQTRGVGIDDPREALHDRLVQQRVLRGLCAQ